MVLMLLLRRHREAVATRICFSWVWWACFYRRYPVRTICPICGRGYFVANAYDGWLCPYGCVDEDELEEDEDE